MIMSTLVIYFVLLLLERIIPNYIKYLIERGLR